MKKIVILRCLRSEENCTGAACLQAFNERCCQFARYGDEEIQLVAYMTCNGCRKITLGDSSGLEEKIERILSINPDVIHVGICCKTRTDDNEYCPEALRLVDIFRNHGIEIIWGTHSDATRHPRKFTYE